MPWRYELRKQQLLAECAIAPEVFEGGIERRAECVQPFAACRLRPEQRDHAQTYLAGLASDLARTNTESIASRPDPERDGVPHFVGSSSGDYRPLRRALARPGGRERVPPAGVIVFDPSGFAQKGNASVGVPRQWLGRLGKVDNGPVGIVLGSVSYRAHALVDVRLSRPKEWAKDRARRQRCGVPKAVRSRTRPERARERLPGTGPLWPHAGVSGDDARGRSSRFRAARRRRGTPYRLAVPSPPTVRDREGEASEGSGRGPHPKRAVERVRTWAVSRPPEAGHRIEGRDGERGPRVVARAATRGVARTDRRRIGPEERRVVRRGREDGGATKHDSYRSNAPPETLPGVRAWVARAGHRIAECLQRGKSEAGQADYPVGTWSGWHHPQALALIAA